MTITGQALHKILRLKGLKLKTGISGSSIYNKINPRNKYYDPSFPKPIRLGAGTVGWLEAEVDAWLEAQAQISRAKVSGTKPSPATYAASASPR
ncbi:MULTISPECIES: AlpA family phage regulatory protein [unclassified Caballeronia]|uniref:helix-turn-helix transcriptional regulator n=1 Tax=unclassified Caballeronia TaxID=2646786 RepID=UPI00202818B2|nr:MULTISPECIES: AlpA family phage regulatory protein [unclassified Caballeronia]